MIKPHLLLKSVQMNPTLNAESVLCNERFSASVTEGNTDEPFTAPLEPRNKTHPLGDIKQTQTSQLLTFKIYEFGLQTFPKDTKMTNEIFLKPQFVLLDIEKIKWNSHWDFSLGFLLFLRSLSPDIKDCDQTSEISIWTQTFIIKWSELLYWFYSSILSL